LKPIVSKAGKDANAIENIIRNSNKHKKNEPINIGIAVVLFIIVDRFVDY